MGTALTLKSHPVVACRDCIVHRPSQLNRDENQPPVLSLIDDVLVLTVIVKKPKEDSGDGERETTNERDCTNGHSRRKSIDHTSAEVVRQRTVDAFEIFTKSI